jgi:hypothetical protein
MDNKTLFRVVYKIMGFDQEFSDFIMADNTLDAVVLSFNSREKKHPQINWSYMYDTHGNDLGTQVVRIEEFGKPIVHGPSEW